LPFCKIVLKGDIARDGFPSNPETFAEHILAARLERGLSQGELATLLGVTESTVWNWEDGRSSPPVHACREVIGFLGYDPFPLQPGNAGMLLAFRRRMGLRVKDAAAKAGVDAGTWSSWEKGNGAGTAGFQKTIAIIGH